MDRRHRPLSISTGACLIDAATLLGATPAAPAEMARAPAGAIAALSLRCRCVALRADPSRSHGRRREDPSARDRWQSCVPHSPGVVCAPRAGAGDLGRCRTATWWHQSGAAQALPPAY